MDWISIVDSQDNELATASHENLKEVVNKLREEGKKPYRMIIIKNNKEDLKNEL